MPRPTPSQSRWPPCPSSAVGGDLCGAVVPPRRSHNVTTWPCVGTGSWPPSGRSRWPPTSRRCMRPRHGRRTAEAEGQRRDVSRMYQNGPYPAVSAWFALCAGSPETQALRHQPARATTRRDRPMIYGMQGVRGSSPLSSTRISGDFGPDPAAEVVPIGTTPGEVTPTIAFSVQTQALRAHIWSPWPSSAPPLFA